MPTGKGRSTSGINLPTGWAAFAMIYREFVAIDNIANNLASMGAITKSQLGTIVGPGNRFLEGVEFSVGATPSVSAVSNSRTTKSRRVQTRKPKTTVAATATPAAETTPAQRLAVAKHRSQRGSRLAAA